MTNLPTPSQGAPYVWASPCDAQGNATSTTNPANVNISEINGTTAVEPSLGQNTSSNSLPVVLPSDQAGISDGLTSLPGSVMYIQSGGGPQDVNGISQGARLDRVKSWQGSAVGGSAGNITATLVGDTSLVFGAVPNDIAPGIKIQLSVGSGAAVETVVVSNSFIPSSSTTTVPLAYPVVNAGNTTAKWDTYNVFGPKTLQMLPHDLLPAIQVGTDPNSFLPYAILMGTLDARTATGYLEYVPGLVNSTTANSGTLDRQRNNVDSITLAASAARTGTFTGTDQTNYNARGVIVVVDVTALTATGTLTLEIDMKDPVSGKYISLLTAAAAIGATGTFVYQVYPGIGTAVTNSSVTQSASMVLPRTWRIVVTHGNAVSITYSVGGAVIL